MALKFRFSSSQIQRSFNFRSLRSQFLRALVNTSPISYERQGRQSILCTNFLGFNPLSLFSQGKHFIRVMTFAFQVGIIILNR